MEEHQGPADDMKTDALRNQLATLEEQREQLASLLGDDPQEPLLQLQAELGATIDGIRRSLENGQNSPSLGDANGEEPEFVSGDTCLAPRVFDRRRARAVVEAVDAGNGTCLVTWVHPRHKREMACHYWKEVRNCKFSGPDCPFSHGVEVPLADLLPDQPGRKASSAGLPPGSGDGNTGASAGSPGRTSGSEGDNWLGSLGAGSRVLAQYHDRVWYEAAVDGPKSDGLVAVRFKGFEDEGLVSVSADHSHLAPLDYGIDGAEDARGSGGGGGGRGRVTSPASDSEESELEDAWADVPIGHDCGGQRFFQERVLGNRRVAGAGGGGSKSAGGGKGAEHGGLSSDVYVFGDWEQHTKGFGSRMMNRMGYRRGEGLGKEKQGIARPVPIRVLPERRALDHLRVDGGGGGGAPGAGARKHKSKPGAASSLDTHEPQKAMFDFLNVTIHASAKGKVGPGNNSLRPVSQARPSLAGRRPVFDGASRAGSGGGGGGGGGERKGSAEGGAVGSASAAGNGAAPAKNAADMSRSELRSHVVGAREAEVALAAKVARLEETVERNSERDPRIAAAARQKLEEIRAQGRQVRASRDRAERVLGDRGSSKGKGGGKGGLFSF